MSQFPEPPIAGADVSSRAAARMTDEQLLRREADSARAAMSRATEKIKRGAMHAADPTAWAETHPWMSVGTAAAAGFAAAKVVCTPREEHSSRGLFYGGREVGYKELHLTRIRTKAAPGRNRLRG